MKNEIFVPTVVSVSGMGTFESSFDFLTFTLIAPVQRKVLSLVYRVWELSILHLITPVS
jgi:hypothetical protein